METGVQTGLRGRIARQLCFSDEKGFATRMKQTSGLQIAAASAQPRNFTTPGGLARRFPSESCGCSNARHDNNRSYTALHQIAITYVAAKCIARLYGTLHHNTVPCTILQYIVLFYNTSQHMHILHRPALNYTTQHGTTRRNSARHYITLQYNTLQQDTLHDFTVPFTTVQYIEQLTIRCAILQRITLHA